MTKIDDENMTICPGYCGVTCVDCSCPIANRDTYIEYGIPVTWSCEDCSYYRGCKDCAFVDFDLCVKNS